MTIVLLISFLLACLVQDVASVICKTKTSTTIHCQTDCCGTKCCDYSNFPIYLGCSVGAIILVIAVIASVYACAKTNFKPSRILSPATIAKKMDLPPFYSASPPQGHFRCFNVSPVPPAYTDKQVPPPPYTARRDQ